MLVQNINLLNIRNRYRPNTPQKINFKGKDGLPDNFGIVDEGKLYRSANILSKSEFEKLKEKGVTFIVDLRDPAEDGHSMLHEKSRAYEFGLEHISFPDNEFCRDMEKLYKITEDIYKKIQKGGVGLIHCTMGEQRTGWVAAAYKFLYKNADFKTVVDDYNRYCPNADSISIYMLDFIKEVVDAKKLLKSI
ncbi:MAG TPA: tyrosine-protein phosphatase [Candidatus Gastranaerophilaceae bacterium]|nr:tyrosine-protein phosphatase [Candidatus Gastranaerophilaceae bacterium]HPT40752.1 tyrosine-protein phosphatase [Candidatus Gastranaerophilaceae bacterium]